jgi:hypothetical protein
VPFRFRRSIRIVPGLRLNVGRRGLSASVGGREGHVSAGTGGVRATAILPGTGISYTVTTPHGGAGRRRSPQPGGWAKWLGSAAIVLAGLWWFGWL